MNFWKQTNGGVEIAPIALLFGSQFTAGSAGDNVAATSPSVDRFKNGSCQLVVAAKTNLAANNTLSVSVAISDSDDNSTFNTAKAIGSYTVATGATAGDLCTYPININLSGFARYVKFIITPDLSASGTDTATVNAYVNLCGSDKIPA